MDDLDHPGALLDLSQDVISVVDHDGRIRYVTRAVKRLLGHDPDDLVGETALVVVDDADRDRVRARMVSVRGDPGATTEPFEWRARRADGNRVWMESVVSNRTDTVLDGYVVVSRDVSGRKAAENAARETRTYLRELADSASDVLWMFDADFEELLFVNAAYPEIYGGSIDELEANPQSFLETIHPEDREEVLDAVGRLTEGESVELEYRVNASEDYSRWVWVQGTPIFDDGEVIRITGFSRDVTQRKQQAEWFRSLIEDGMDVVAVLDRDGTVSYVTPSVTRVLGYERGEVVGDPLSRYVHPEDRRGLAEVLDHVVDDPDGGASTELRLRNVDGEWRDLDVTVSDQLSNQAVEGIVVNARDVTERRERERQLRVLDRVLRHNAHNDLDVVMGYAEAIADATDDEDVEAFAEEIRDHSRSLLETVDKEREIVELLVQDVERARFDVATTVRRVVESLLDRYPEADVRLDAPESATATAVVTFELAVLELVENAIVHHDATPWIHVSVEANDESVRVRIVDDGPTIPGPEIGVLLDEYDVDPLFHGSGMGLWMVRWIVSHSNGKLSFEERSPRGNEITIELSSA